MLKIKDSVDLELLEDLGFYECDEFGVINYRYEKYPYCLRISNSRIIIIEYEKTYDYFATVDDKIICKLYDLIKADMVDKVEE